MRLQDISAPQTQASRAAFELAASCHSPALLNHVVRSWLWAEAFALVEDRRDVDHELLYTSALLHDIGLVPAYDNVTLSYEEAGGHVAVALTAGAGWPAERRQRALEVIVRHNWPSVDPGLDVEGHLLEVATGLDISGSRPDALPREFVRDVLTAPPAPLARRRVHRAGDRPGRAQARPRQRTGWSRAAWPRSWRTIHLRAATLLPDGASCHTWARTNVMKV